MAKPPSRSRKPAATSAQEAPPAFVRAWMERKPGQIIGRGHPAGDFLEAWKWKVLEEGPGLLRIAAHLPDHVKNPRGQLFGGFTPTYVDLVALFTVRAGDDAARARLRSWLATTNMRVDYFEPVLGEFVLESRVVKRRGRTIFVDTRFLDESGELLVFAVTTLREVKLDRGLGDA